VVVCSGMAVSSFRGVFGPLDGCHPEGYTAFIRLHTL
jgi:hypothetical protein